MKIQKHKILVIEDDAVLNNNICGILTEEGFLVESASDGEKGIELIYSYHPDLIICDISMPKKNGYEVLSETLKTTETKNIPFIFLTAKVEKEDIRKGMQLGADDYIFKPFSIDDLLNSVKIRLEKKSYLQPVISSEIKNEQKNYEADDKIMLKFNRNIQLVPVRDIKYFKANSPYVLVKCKSGKSALMRGTLDEWEAKLPEKLFLRIHRSKIINTDFINKFEKLSPTSYIIRLIDEAEPFIISKRYASRIKNRYGAN